MDNAPAQRLRRLRSLSHLLDSAIRLPGGYRIGLDGLIGLIPGFGDIAGGVASSYIIIEASKLGATVPTLLKMVFNVLLESLIGIIPFLGDLFDFAWKANEKNLNLLEKQLKSPLPTSTPEKRLEITLVIILLILFAGVLALAYLGFRIFVWLFSVLQSGVPA